MTKLAPIPAARAGLPVYIPSPPPEVVIRPRLIERLDETASAGSLGKTTLVSEWVAGGS